MKILALGDVVGSGAVAEIGKKLWSIRSKHGIDLVVANAENCAENNGIDEKSARALLDFGADVLTTGNHVFKNSSVYSFLDDSGAVIRPANYPAESPGAGYTILRLSGLRVLVINVMGVIYTEPLDSPFDTVEKILKKENGNYDVSVLDIHAEATSEKLALARYFDGRISVIFGTHTHVQTSDARVLQGGSGYITDLGMCGPEDSILGVISERVIDRLRLHMPRRFEISQGDITLSGAVFEVDESTGRCIRAEGIYF